MATALPEITVGAGVFLDWGQDEWFGGCYSVLGPGDEARLGVFALEGSFLSHSPC